MLMCKVGGLMLMNLGFGSENPILLFSFNKCSFCTGILSSESYKIKSIPNFDMTPLDKNKPGECECEHLLDTQKYRPNSSQ